MPGGPTPGRLRKEIVALGYSTVRYRSYRHLVDDDGQDPTKVFGGIFTSFFYIEIRPPFPFPWGVGGRWGPLPVGDGAPWGNAPFLWGFGGAETWQFDELRRTIAKWKPAGSSCRFVEIQLHLNIFGIPTEVRRIPVWEDWELDSNGAARDFYNNSFLVERV